MQALLSFDKSPPFSAPLRFLLSGLAYGLLAGLLLLLMGESAFSSRWAPATLALTHLLAIGFMLQIMLGALIQILPVVAGANLARPALLANVVHPLLNAGCLALVAGFLWASPGLLHAGGGLLALAVGFFLAFVTQALWPVPSTSPTIRGLKLACGALLVTVGLGFVLVLTLAGGWSWPLMALTDLHAAWGLAGWSGILLAAVAYVVVPMFQLTPGYPARAGWVFPLAIGLVLLAWSLAVAADWPWLARVSQGLLALIGLAFCGLTLRLQAQRKRPRPDVTLRYWQAGLMAAILAFLMLLTASCWPAVGDDPAWGLLFGVLLLGAAFPAFIVGMLHKILPFLAWLHLQNGSPAGVAVPPMNRLLPEGDSRWPLRLFLAANGLLTAAVFWPAALARPAGLCLLLAYIALLVSLFRVVVRYRRHRHGLEHALAAEGGRG